LKDSQRRGRKESLRAVVMGTLRKAYLFSPQVLEEIIPFGLSQCLLFLLFSSTPSSSFLSYLATKRRNPMFVRCEISKASQEEEERDGLRAVGMRT
jgi:hypothetical protein